jgi:hypothetical protein
MTPLEGNQPVEANEGIWISAVISAIRKKFDTAKAGDA